MKAEDPAEWVGRSGQAPIATSPFCLPRMIYVPSGNGSRLYGVLADLPKSVTADKNGNLPFRTEEHRLISI